MELKDFTGKHFLSGFDTTSIPNWDNADQDYDGSIIARFVVDGVTYNAIENPDDGLRSFLDEIVITNEEVTNSFPPQEVIGHMVGDDRMYVIEFIDVVTGKTVLGIGTDHTDDLYPFCVMNWFPQNLAINQNRY